MLKMFKSMFRNSSGLFLFSNIQCYIACIIPHSKMYLTMFLPIFLVVISIYSDQFLLSYSLLNPVLQVIMVQKRSFDAEEILEGSFKHPKHAGPSHELFSLSESVFPDDDYHAHMPKPSGGCLVDGPSNF